MSADRVSEQVDDFALVRGTLDAVGGMIPAGRQQALAALSRIEARLAAAEYHVSQDRRDVMPSEVADTHTQMPFASPHGAYRQRHDAKCYFCALLDQLGRYEKALREIAGRHLPDAVNEDSVIARAALADTLERLPGPDDVRGILRADTPEEETP